MKSRSRDAIVGIFITLVLVLLLLGLIWLGEGRRFTGGIQFFASFDNVQGLKPGAKITMRGIEIGIVEDLELMSDKVIVALRTNPEVKIPAGSYAKIIAFSYLGGEKHVEILPGSGPEMSSGDTIPGQRSIGIEELMAKLENLTEGLDFKPLNQNLDQLNKIVTSQLGGGIKRIKKSLDRLDQVTKRIDSILIGVQKDGTVGNLIKSDELYQELRNTNKELRTLIKDIRKNPERYFNIKVEVF